MSQESCYGGAGLAGASVLDFEDLPHRFGATVAETVAKWARSEAIERQTDTQK